MLPDKDELVECLRTGCFDAKNKQVRKCSTDLVKDDEIIFFRNKYY